MEGWYPLEGSPHPPGPKEDEMYPQPPVTGMWFMYCLRKTHSSRYPNISDTQVVALMWVSFEAPILSNLRSDTLPRYLLMNR